MMPRPAIGAWAVPSGAEFASSMEQYSQNDTITKALHNFLGDATTAATLTTP
jgi:hypothetical protein